MNQNSVQLPAIGSSEFFNYLVTYTKAIEPLPQENISYRGHVFFYGIGMLDYIADSTHAPERYQIRRILTDYKKRLKDNTRYAIVLDYSTEGPAFDLMCASMFKALHDLLAELDIPTSKVFFIQQNRLMLSRGSGYHAWCARMGITPMHIRYAHWWILDQAARLHLKFNASKFGIRHGFNEHRNRLLSSFALDTNRKTHKYLCFNYFPRLPRVMLLLQLLEQDLLKEGLVSFPGFRVSELDHDFMEDVLLNIDQWKVGARLKSLLSKLQALAPMVVDGGADLTLDSLADPHSREFRCLQCGATLDEPGAANLRTCPRCGASWVKDSLSNQFVDEPYLKTVFSVVTETEFSNGYDTRRVTEKFLKSAANMHPFMISGNPHTLAEIRRLGFRTFEPFFDEAYDEILEPEPRMAAVLDNIKRKCSLSLPELIQDVQKILPIMRSNLDHVANGLWKRMREESEYPLLNELRESIGAREFSASEDYLPPRLEFPKNAKAIDEPPFSEALQEAIKHDVEFDFHEVHAYDKQRSYVKLRESPTHGDHCVMLRTNRDLTLPFLFSLDIKSRGVERVTIDLKEPSKDNFRGTFDLKLGIFIESSNLDYLSTITSVAANLGDDWYRLSFRGQIGNGTITDSLDIVIYLINPVFVYTGDPSREVWLSKFSLQRFVNR